MKTLFLSATVFPYVKNFNVKNINKSDTRGAIALTAMVVLGAVIILIVSSVTLLGISGRYNSLQLHESDIVFIKAEGCMEEALLQLSRNSDYPGSSYNVDGTDCIVSVSGSGSQRVLMLEAAEQNFYHHFTVDVQIDPLFGILGFSY